MRPTRVRVRTLMIAVAVVAFLAAGGSMWRRRARCLVIGQQHAALAASHAVTEASLSRTLSLGGEVEGDPAVHHRLAAYHAALRGKYEYAASHPWLPVPPDPPPPE